ncbi:MAG: phage major capsid protein, partial [Candidatus Angelobacter sp.]
FFSPSLDVNICFGDLSRFIRRVAMVEVKSYAERYAEYGQVGFEGFMRCDGHLLRTDNAAPIKYLVEGTGS